MDDQGPNNVADIDTHYHLMFETRERVDIAVISLLAATLAATLAVDIIERYSLISLYYDRLPSALSQVSVGKDKLTVYVPFTEEERTQFRNWLVLALAHKRRHREWDE